MKDVMLDHVIAFPNQLRESLEIGRNATITPSDKKFNKVVVLGMGGSGFGADLVSELVAGELAIPYLGIKDYEIPNHIDENTLVIASSYSGNTEETLYALDLAIARKPKVVCVASGGKLKEKAIQHGFDFVEIPGGYPPRACLGYSFIQQLFILFKLGLISDQTIKDAESSIAHLENHADEIKGKAEELTNHLFGKLPIIYATNRIASLALRARQQINENSKMLCMSQVVPEMNHNEVIGWRKEDNYWAVVFLYLDNDFSRNVTRVNINKEIIVKYTPNIMELVSKGNSLTEKVLYLNNIIDYASVYLGHKNGMNATEVDVIDFLKGSLAKIPIA